MSKERLIVLFIIFTFLFNGCSNIELLKINDNSTSNKSPIYPFRGIDVNPILGSRNALF